MEIPIARTVWKLLRRHHWPGRLAILQHGCAIPAPAPGRTRATINRFNMLPKRIRFWSPWSLERNSTAPDDRSVACVASGGTRPSFFYDLFTKTSVFNHAALYPGFLVGGRLITATL